MVRRLAGAVHIADHGERGCPIPNRRPTRLGAIHRGIETRFKSALGATSPMKFFLTIALALALALVGSPSGPLQAEVEVTPSSEETPSSEALDAARDLLALMSRDMLAQLARKCTDLLLPAIELRLRAYNPNIEATRIAELRKELEHIQVEYMMNIVKDGPAVYARHFTAEELHEIIAFYRTPTGSKVLRITPQLSNEVMAIIAPHVPDFYSRTLEVFTKVLRTRGYYL